MIILQLMSRMRYCLDHLNSIKTKQSTANAVDLLVITSNRVEDHQGIIVEVYTCSFLGFQRFALIGVEEAKGRILCFAILCLGALP